MTDAEIIDAILEREGGYIAHASDRGGATKFGVTAATLGEWRNLGRPASYDEVKHLAVSEARAIYLALYIEKPNLGALPTALKPMVVDDAVLSGTETAIKTLQQVLGVTADGVCGPKTLAAAHLAPPKTEVALVTARCLRYGRIVQRDPEQVVFLVGWLRRALDFLA